ncbi:uncharacterized protein LOC110683642 [Chenopodium quinoa]|uniref:uncharacterized protein LOC110683642 n=1 Tax=Chenopodium quinoa TaxID=63459 RepID=UPI000B784B87|nr:uncharacterized protein LOC110683642 [Chenopodium quinoa]
MEVPADEVVLDGEQRDLEESGSDEEAPSTSGSSGVREVDGEGAASSNEADDAKAGQGSRAESSGSDQDNFAADYQQPPKVADNPNTKRTRMLPGLRQENSTILLQAAQKARRRSGENSGCEGRQKDPPPQKQSSAQSGRPTTGGKSLAAMKILSESSERSQQKAPDASTASKGGEPPIVAAGAATPGEEQKPAPHPDTQEEALKMVDQDKTPAKSAAQLRKEAALAKKAAVEAKDKKGGESAKRIPRSFSKLLKRKGDGPTSDQPDLPSFAKRMVRILTRSEKASIPDLQVVDFDRIMGSLAEEELIRSLTAANDEANSRADDLDKQLKDAKSDLKALEDSNKENAQLRTNNYRLKLELMTLRNKQADELAQEQTRLTEENERDNFARLKITWGLLYPEIDFEVYKLRYDYATEVYDAQQLGDAPPPRFKDWASEQGYEVSDDDEEQADDQQKGQAN